MNPGYRLYHPKWHRRRTPIFWWLRKLAYTRFITRELTSLAVGYSALLLLAEAWALFRGEEAHRALTGLLASPLAIAWHLLILAVLTFHTVTWLLLAPKALVLRLGGRRIPDTTVILAHFLAWAAASAAVAWLLVGGG